MVSVETDYVSYAEKIPKEYGIRYAIGKHVLYAIYPKQLEKFHADLPLPCSPTWLTSPEIPLENGCGFFILGKNGNADASTYFSQQGTALYTNNDAWQIEPRKIRFPSVINSWLLYRKQYNKYDPMYILAEFDSEESIWNQQAVRSNFLVSGKKKRSGPIRDFFTFFCPNNPLS